MLFIKLRICEAHVRCLSSGFSGSACVSQAIRIWKRMLSKFAGLGYGKRMLPFTKLRIRSLQTPQFSVPATFDPKLRSGPFVAHRFLSSDDHVLFKDVEGQVPFVGKLLFLSKFFSICNLHAAVAPKLVLAHLDPR